MAGEGAGFLWGSASLWVSEMRKPLATAYPLINRHQLNLQTTPRNGTYMEKPSEGILTILCPREITRERNAMNVKNVRRRLVTLYPLGSTCNLRLLRNGTIFKFFILMDLAILKDLFKKILSTTPASLSPKAFLKNITTKKSVRVGVGERASSPGHEIWEGRLLGGGEGLYIEGWAQCGPSRCELLVEFAHMGAS